MNAKDSNAASAAATPADLAAELTQAVYPIALRHGVVERWLDFELELWQALLETIKKWQPERLCS